MLKVARCNGEQSFIHFWFQINHIKDKILESDPFACFLQFSGKNKFIKYQIDLHRESMIQWDYNSRHTKYQKNKCPKPLHTTLNNTKHRNSEVEQTWIFTKKISNIATFNHQASTNASCSSKRYKKNSRNRSSHHLL